MGRTLTHLLVAIAAVGLMAAASPPKQSSTGQQQREGAQATQAQPPAAPVKKADGAPDPNQPCPEGKDDRKSDLCAQWKAADAAHEAASWAEPIYGLTFIGLIIGGLTTLAAGVAAVFAWRAAFHTRRAANYASDSHQAFVNAEDASLVLLFPYIKFTEVRGKGAPEDYFNVRIGATNVGRSAAHIHAIAVEQDHAAIFNDTLKPGDTATFEGSFRVPVVDMRHTLIVVVVSYSTALSAAAQLTVRGHLHHERKSESPPTRDSGIFIMSDIVGGDSSILVGGTEMIRRTRVVAEWPGSKKRKG